VHCFFCKYEHYEICWNEDEEEEEKKDRRKGKNEEKEEIEF
jgi:hypothetical protein